MKSWDITIKSQRFVLMVEGKVRHYVTDLEIGQGDEITFKQHDTGRKAVFTASFVESLNDPDSQVVVSLKLQAWASPDLESSIRS